MRTVLEWKTAVAELKRRKVFRVGSLYLVAAWGASLGAAELFPAFGVPDWGVRAFVITMFLGFPVAVALAWAFEITPQGVIRDPGKDGDAWQPLPDENPYLPADTTMSATTRADTHTVRVKWQNDQRAHVRDFQSDFVVGRDTEADIRLVHNRISRQHARVHYEGGRWWVSDLGSRNGTYLNGQLITKASPLNSTNEIQLSKDGPVIVVSVFQLNGQTVLDGI